MTNTKFVGGEIIRCTGYIVFVECIPHIGKTKTVDQFFANVKAIVAITCLFKKGTEGAIIEALAAINVVWGRPRSPQGS